MEETFAMRIWLCLGNYWICFFFCYRFFSFEMNFFFGLLYRMVRMYCVLCQEKLLHFFYNSEHLLNWYFLHFYIFVVVVVITEQNPVNMSHVHRQCCTHQIRLHNPSNQNSKFFHNHSIPNSVCMSLKRIFI